MQQEASIVQDDVLRTSGSADMESLGRSAIFFSRMSRLARHSIREVLNASRILISGPPALAALPPVPEELETSQVLMAEPVVASTPEEPPPGIDEIIPNICTDPANQLFFLFSLPKSAGNALRMMVDRCRPATAQPSGVPPTLFCPNGLHVELPLTDPVLADFPRGGWHHSHAPATLITLDFLHRHQIRHLVLVRHPLDQLVAYHCHIIKHRRLGFLAELPWNSSLALTNPQAPVPTAAFADETPLEEAFDLLIRRGYLEASLNWIGQWSEFSNPQLSLFLTYEEFVHHPETVLRRVIEFLTPMLYLPEVPLEEVVGELGEYARRSREMESGSEVSAYPRGYTGRVGIHRDYLTEQNLAAAKTVFEKFYRESTYGPLVRAVYPDLEIS